MKKYILLILNLISQTILFSQVAPVWEWATEAGGIAVEQAFGLDIDSQGNILMSGNFSSDISFDNITISSTNISAPDFYIAKYNPLGEIIWVTSGIGQGDDMAYDIVSDEDDNIIITGVFGMFSSSSLAIDTVTLLNAGFGDMFLAKYDSNGNLLWAIREGGSAREWGRSVDVDLQGNIYVCGNFKTGNTNIGGNVIVNSGGYGFFVCKYDANGNLLWYETGNTPGTDLIRNLVVYPETGNVYIFGDFENDSLTIDNITVYNHNEGELDNFLFKLDTYGNALWGQCIGGSSEEKGNFCTVDIRENVYVTGVYESTQCYLGSDTLYNSSNNQGDTYIAMYSYLGDYEWSHSIFGDDKELAYSITSDTMDYVFVTGYFNSSVINIGGQQFSNNGNFDIFVAKFDYQSGFHWATTVGGSGDDKANVITINHNRELFIAGEFNSPSIHFDSDTIYQTNSEDIFLAKLKDYCEMPDVYIGNDTVLYSNEELIIDIPGYQDYYWGNGLSGSSVSIMGSDFNTGYNPITITVIDSSGCVSSDELILTICNYPVIILGDDTTIYDNEQITLNANVGYDNYFWSTGDILPSLIVDGSQLGIGDYFYWVEGSDQYGCTGTDSINITIIPDISIDDIEEDKIIIYPNPVNDYMILSLKEIYEINKIRVFDINMKEVNIEYQHITPTQVIISTSSLRNGIYQVQIISDFDIIMLKFVVVD